MKKLSKDEVETLALIHRSIATLQKAKEQLCNGDAELAAAYLHIAKGEITVAGRRVDSAFPR